MSYKGKSNQNKKYNMNDTILKAMVEMNNTILRHNENDPDLVHEDNTTLDLFLKGMGISFIIILCLMCLCNLIILTDFKIVI